MGNLHLYFMQVSCHTLARRIYGETLTFFVLS
jgi:hypothetical protein